MPKQSPKFNNRSVHKATFQEGKWYNVDKLYDILPGPVIRNMFRKPQKGETTPDGILYVKERDTDFSGYEKCIKSFSISIAVNYN